MNNKTKKDIVEERKGGFACIYCKKWVSFSDPIGTHHRNHCPHCLTSQHVDDEISGDRKSGCLGSMRPVGLTLKEEGFDKYGNRKQGDVMLIHKCERCGKISINRIAADDDNNLILQLLDYKLGKGTEKELKSSGIISLALNDIEKVRTGIFGNQV